MMNKNLSHLLKLLDLNLWSSDKTFQKQQKRMVIILHPPYQQEALALIEKIYVSLFGGSVSLIYLEDGANINNLLPAQIDILVYDKQMKLPETFRSHINHRLVVDMANINTKNVKKQVMIDAFPLSDFAIG
ncbi:MAG: hypothetical protein ACO2ZM_04045 [Francisellaceae bacterium]